LVVASVEPVISPSTQRDYPGPLAAFVEQQHGAGEPFSAGHDGLLNTRRSVTRRTRAAFHLPPRAVWTPRAFNSAAIRRSDIPWLLSSVING
jgi:hypothetical protein